MVKKETIIKIPPGSTVKITPGEESIQEDLANSSSEASYSPGISTEQKQNSIFESKEQAESSSAASVLGSSTISEGSSSSKAKSNSQQSDNISDLESKQDTNDNSTIKVKIKHEFKHK